MITNDSIRNRRAVFTTHNIGIMKAAAKLRKKNAEELKPFEQSILSEAAQIGHEMKDNLPPPPPPNKIKVASTVVSEGTTGEVKKVKRGKAKVGK